MYQVVDAHACGEPARVVVGGMPKVEGTTMQEKREFLREKRDDIRQLMLREPRGYPAQNVNFVFESQVGDFGFVIAEQGNVWPGFSGHNCMCVATVLVETGMIDKTSFTLEAPAGVVQVAVEIEHGRVTKVTIDPDTAYVERLDFPVSIGGVLEKEITIDLAYGSGMTYGIVDAAKIGLSPLDPDRGRDLVRIGEMIKVRARETAEWIHPVTKEPGPEILVIRDGARNSVVMSNGGACDWSRPETFTGMLDRSPCGTGTCAVMAVLHQRNELSVGDCFRHESILGTHFDGSILAEEHLSHTIGIRPRLSGRAWITAFATLVLDPTDPFPPGLPEVRDIW